MDKVSITHFTSSLHHQSPDLCTVPLPLFIQSEIFVTFLCVNVFYHHAPLQLKMTDHSIPPTIACRDEKVFLQSALLSHIHPPPPSSSPFPYYLLPRMVDCYNNQRHNISMCIHNSMQCSAVCEVTNYAVNHEPQIQIHAHYL